LSVPHNGILPYCSKQSCNGDVRLFRCYRIENGEKLLAAPTDEFIAGPKSSSESLTYGSQYRVSRGVAETVVDALEVIYIHEQYAAEHGASAAYGQYVFVKVASIV
jgi:hypothetical protein